MSYLLCDVFNIEDSRWLSDDDLVASALKINKEKGGFYYYIKGLNWTIQLGRKTYKFKLLDVDTLQTTIIDANKLFRLCKSNDILSCTFDGYRGCDSYLVNVVTYRGYMISRCIDFVKCQEYDTWGTPLGLKRNKSGYVYLPYLHSDSYLRLEKGFIRFLYRSNSTEVYDYPCFIGNYIDYLFTRVTKECRDDILKVRINYSVMHLVTFRGSYRGTPLYNLTAIFSISDLETLQKFIPIESNY